MADEPTTCANPDCRIAETGKCVEGLVAAECPHYGKAPTTHVADSTTAKDSEQDDEPEVVRGVPLDNADRLSVEKARRVLARAESRLIAVLGPADSGKTSLVTGIYDLFQLGNIREIGFSRCDSFHGFEQACHDARSASERSVPHMHRTRVGEVAFFHLELSPAQGRSPLNLLIGDRAGEDYSAVADQPSIAQSFPEVARADTISILVDGERLVDLTERHTTTSGAEMLVQGLVDSGALWVTTNLAVVLTKSDALEANSDGDRARSDFMSLVEKINRLHHSVFHSIQSFQTAAAPKTTATPRGDGVAELLRYWVEATVPTASVPRRAIGPRRAISRLRVLDGNS